MPSFNRTDDSSSPLSFPLPRRLKKLDGKGSSNSYRGSYIRCIEEIRERKRSERPEYRAHVAHVNARPSSPACIILLYSGSYWCHVTPGVPPRSKCNHSWVIRAKGRWRLRRNTGRLGPSPSIWRRRPSTCPARVSWQSSFWLVLAIGYEQIAREFRFQLAAALMEIRALWSHSLAPRLPILRIVLSLWFADRR